MCGIGPAHIRRLCNNTWDGGNGYTPSQVGDMTLDQIFMLLCDKKYLRESTKNRIARVNAAIAPRKRDGKVRCVAANGKVIEGTVNGKSLAQRIRESKKR